jgi:hypothetical protein
MSDPGWSNDWWGRDPIEEAGEPPMTEEEERIEAEERAERMREENQAAFLRLKQYIEEHRGETLGLELAASLFRRN